MFLDQLEDYGAKLILCAVGLFVILYFVILPVVRVYLSCCFPSYRLWGSFATHPRQKYNRLSRLARRMNMTMPAYNLYKEATQQLRFPLEEIKPHPNDEDDLEGQIPDEFESKVGHLKDLET